MTGLRALAKRTGCEAIVSPEATAGSLREWQAALPFTIEKDDSQWEMIADTRPLGVKGVHEAAKVAGIVLRAASAAAESKPDIATASAGEILDWCVANQAAEVADLRARLMVTVEESSRRAAERDRLKGRLSEARQKVDRLKAKLDHIQKQGLFAYLPTWLRPGRKSGSSR